MSYSIVKKSVSSNIVKKKAKSQIMNMRFKCISNDSVSHLTVNLMYTCIHRTSMNYEFKRD